MADRGFCICTGCEGAGCGTKTWKNGVAGPAWPVCRQTTKSKGVKKNFGYCGACFWYADEAGLIDWQGNSASSAAGSREGDPPSAAGSRKGDPPSVSGSGNGDPPPDRAPLEQAAREAPPDRALQVEAATRGQQAALQLGTIVTRLDTIVARLDGLEAAREQQVASDQQAAQQHDATMGRIETIVARLDSLEATVGRIDAKMAHYTEILDGIANHVKRW